MFSNEEMYVLGLMAREASMGRDGWSVPNEYQANEAAVFAAMQMDRENINAASQQQGPELAQ